MFKLLISRRTRDFLEKLPPKQFRQVVRKILSLCENPHPPDAIHLKGYPYLRVDVGEYRIIYYPERDELRIVLVGKRNDEEVYKRLSRREV
ncbi:MAG TPA: type II toxin-antitoxin system RelE/ParE family toxin [Thermosulfurimonas dismutans]|uniref:Type II toxin-antitoxin system RelE/ParE family toxin n=1 Tax=Thermosulfurimonas dismutans TaxID=999894 RepID=A0A7C3CH19_9BACT|nr:type II toxin-antitoxin system RelE/ParE family toxin [Thermosulfurimonas dismutans]